MAIHRKIILGLFAFLLVAGGGGIYLGIKTGKLGISADSFGLNTGACQAGQTRQNGTCGYFCFGNDHVGTVFQTTPCTQPTVSAPTTTAPTTTKPVATTTSSGGSSGGGSTSATSPKPTISAVAVPSTITAGQSTTLEWAVNNASGSVSISGLPAFAVVNGGVWQNYSVKLSATTTFTFSVSGAGGSASTQVTVTVNPATTTSISPTTAPTFTIVCKTSPCSNSSTSAPVISAHLGQTSVVAGTTFYFEYATSNATSIVITGPGLPEYKPAVGAVGEWKNQAITLTEPGTYTFTISATGAGGTTTKTVDYATGSPLAITVTAKAPTPTASSFTPAITCTDSSNLLSGATGSITFSATGTNRVTGRITSGGTGSQFTYDSGVLTEGSSYSKSVQVGPFTADTQITFFAAAAVPNGTSYAQCHTNITVTPQPTITHPLDVAKYQTAGSYTTASLSAGDQAGTVRICSGTDSATITSISALNETIPTGTSIEYQVGTPSSTSAPAGTTVPYSWVTLGKEAGPTSAGQRYFYPTKSVFVSASSTIALRAILLGDGTQTPTFGGFSLVCRPISPTPTASSPSPSSSATASPTASVTSSTTPTSSTTTTPPVACLTDAGSKTPADYRARFVSQNSYPTLKVGESYKFEVTLKNVGTTTWDANTVFLGTDRNRDRVPGFTREDKVGNNPSGWVKPNRIKMASDCSVVPGDTATFDFWYTVPAGTKPGVYREYFRPVADGITWMDDWGIYWDVTVTK